MSVGAAFCPQDGFEVEPLLAEADRRMYSVKEAHQLRTQRRPELFEAARRATTVN